MVSNIKHHTYIRTYMRTYIHLKAPTRNHKYHSIVPFQVVIGLFLPTHIMVSSCAWHTGPWLTVEFAAHSNDISKNNMIIYFTGGLKTVISCDLLKPFTPSAIQGRANKIKNEHYRNCLTVWSTCKILLLNQLGFHFKQRRYLIFVAHGKYSLVYDLAKAR